MLRTRLRSHRFLENAIVIAAVAKVQQQKYTEGFDTRVHEYEIH